MVRTTYLSYNAPHAFVKADALYSSLFSQQGLVKSIHGLVQCAIITAIVADFGFYLLENCDIEPLKAVEVYKQRMSTEPVAQAAERAFQEFVRSGSGEQLARDMNQIVFDNRMPIELLKDPIVTGKKQT
ncbi:hypothetical protein FRC18_002046 [Serendipita sp. 400]|nr:hypothetical protein FRC18_002046 [Serendipita sp. 400]